MWVLRRVIVLGLILVVLCAAVVVVARANPAPSGLQALGFYVCDGEPCWWGIKVGTPREIARNVFPSLQEEMYAEEGTEDWLARVIVSSTVAELIIEPSNLASSWLGVPISAGDFVALYGSPCRVLASQSQIVLFYPNLIVSIYPESLGRDLRLNVNTRFHTIRWLYLGPDEGCNLASRLDIGAWQGFTSVDIYHTRFDRVLVGTRTP
jgi:hypothetical protein